MRAIGTLIIFLSTLVFTIFGGLFIAFSLNVYTLENLTVFLQLAYQFENIHTIVGAIGLFLVLASIFTAQISLGKVKREKTICFSNPNGEVTVSLSAIEDFIKRLSMSIVEIKDLRTSVRAGKKGIEIDNRVSLWADANIPDTTSNVQDVIKNRIQDILGIEDPIIVRVHVGKIVQKERKKLKKQEKELVEEPSSFRGSIEYGKEG